MPKIYSIDTKLSLINFYNSELFTIVNALYIFNISKSTLYNWINLYNEQLLHVSNNRSTYKSKISPPIHKYIITYVTKKVSFNIKNLRRYIRNIFNVFVSKSSIYRILAINNITNKKFLIKLFLINSIILK